jgi:hypothetical protein
MSIDRIPRLTIPRDEAIEKLRKEIIIISEFKHREIRTEATLEEAKLSLLTWHEYTCDLLKVIFETNYYWDEFRRGLVHREPNSSELCRII